MPPLTNELSEYNYGRGRRMLRFAAVSVADLFAPSQALP
jgi:hypothetical protein